MPTITTINPATGENVEIYDVMTDRDATGRIEACHAALLDEDALREAAG